MRLSSSSLLARVVGDALKPGGNGLDGVATDARLIAYRLRRDLQLLGDWDLVEDAISEMINRVRSEIGKDLADARP